MSDLRPILEYMSDTVTLGKPALNTDVTGCPADGDMAVPMEYLEARICELAGHLTAATCQFLLLLADFDTRRGWADWEMPSCSAWLSWKCQIAGGTAREHVRVARLLGSLPVIRQEFAAGRLSYAKVRALTRIATPDTEHDLVQMATPMTANQLERFARAHRQVSRAEQREVTRRRKLTWRYDENKSIGITLWLPPEQGAVVLQALRAWTSDLDHPHDPGDAESPPSTRAQILQERDDANAVDWAGPNPPWQAWQEDKTPAEDLADAIVGICGHYLSGRASSADNPDTYQVIIHAGTGAITSAPDEPPEPSGRVSAETRDPDPVPAFLANGAPHDPALLRLPPTHPAYPMRCHIEDGLALSPATLQMIACNATITTMLHDANGNLLNAGRRTRKPPPALRRAARERDRYRCRFPGCESRRIDLHHILFWANGGETSLANLICLCKRHHTLVHDTGIIIATAGGEFAFHKPDGTLIEASPPLPASTPGAITGCHDATITASTIIPPHSGERLNLHLAIWTCFANAKIKAARREHEQASTIRS
jgi:Domain of unknown function (DUF222)